MKIAVFSTKSYDQEFLNAANHKHGHDLHYFNPRLSKDTVPVAKGFDGVCVFVNDQLNAGVLQALHANGTRLVALRCAGFNNVDIEAADKLGITVVRVPAYSPHSVAEHTLALILALDRRIHKAYNRTREGNFALQGLLGFELNSKTVGIIGTGKIGCVVAGILRGFGCKVLAFDPYENEHCLSLGVEYTSLPDLFQRADIISLHCPLNRDTHHLIDADALAQMQDGVMLINTSRGAIVDTKAVIRAIKTGKIGFLGLDVYEQEGDLFFEDLSEQIIGDDDFQRLLTFPNVVLTAHQGFFTDTALTNIAATTISNITEFESGNKCKNTVTPELIVKK